MKIAVDVSSFQTRINWDLVKAEGISHAIIRTILKDGTKDLQLIRNYEDCQRVGISCDLYKYTYATDSVSALWECNQIYNCLKLYDIRNFGTLYVDMETEELWGNCPKDTTREIYNTYKTFFNDRGIEVGLYTNENRWVLYFNKSYFETEKKWIARYPYTGDCDKDNYDLTFAPTDADIWQFTSNGIVDGIIGYVDLNVILNEVEEIEYYPIPKLTLVQALENIGVDSSYSNREKIASANNILNYTGSYHQNTTMLNLLMRGELCK